MTKSEAAAIGRIKSVLVVKAKWAKVKQQYNENPIKCKQCGKNISYEKRKNVFCSRSCSVSYNNKGTCKHGILHGTCLTCGQSLIGKGSKARYCSMSCHWNYNKKIIIENWLKGEFNASQPSEKVSRPIRNYLLEQSKYKCSRCGWGERNEFLKTVPLTLHHIDGDCRNSTPNNLIVLCPNCHSLTKTWIGMNRGNGRPLRRSKYIRVKT